MSIFTKLITLFRGTAHEAGAAVVDANALRILDQEIRDADNALGRARDDLATLVAKRRMLEKELQGLSDQSGRYESSARAALAKGDEALAMEVATRISELESEVGLKTPQLADMRSAEERMHQTIATTQQRVENLRREIDVVKVNDSVQRAQAAVASQGAGASARLGSAADSLKRIKERQAIADEKFKAAGELEDRRTGADLDAKLKAAGILPGHSSANDVLARLKAPKEDPMPQLEAPRLQIEAQPVPVKRGEES
ncbi:MAG: PspA/IM30 family protein [Alphaproteobacteria bacterium]|nr:PspA/IM30 family protein [Alphaproteobacteria bacterium]MBU1515007.1 PspA/IM30 family protein [Alphaproteobacteria bacterium]MBU2095656.1 PspA/IM30 family protein [Alphaproteobacteria bacterium]MBU2151040.1 PspA/IM30 family protein [Alphaproteobacteria bacterium]MBU2306903.1 PspA/IM30 family protein [Alphaproteobacteria bacterium]